MDSARPSSPENLLTLNEAALKLGVSVEVLLKWNVYHILKPTITQSGEIAYTKDQIEEFLTIRQAANPQESVKSLPFSQDVSTTTSQENLVEFPKSQADSGEQTNTIPAKENMVATGRNKYVTPLLISSFTAVLTLVVLIGVTQKDNISNITAYHVDQKTASKETGPLNALANSGQLTDDSQSKGETSRFAQQVASVLATQDQTSKVKKASTTAAVANSKDEDTSTDFEPNSGIVIDGKLFTVDSPLASKITRDTSEKNTTTSPLNGQDKSSDISMLVGGSNIIANGTSLSQTNNNLRNQFIMLSLLGAMGLMLYLKSKRSFGNSYQTSNNSANSLLRKVLEIDQKMDGTVFLSFKGSSYKISKPELYSDSDRFIERLMDLVQPGLKEIEYDSFTDEKMRLTAPLSRLVTRLGFVGIKRDIFFPRTSKNRVLFRKYVTEKDLASMNLTEEKIEKDLLQNL